MYMYMVSNAFSYLLIQYISEADIRWTFQWIYLLEEGDPQLRNL